MEAGFRHELSRARHAAREERRRTEIACAMALLLAAFFPHDAGAQVPSVSSAATASTGADVLDPLPSWDTSTALPGSSVSGPVNSDTRQYPDVVGEADRAVLDTSGGASAGASNSTLKTGRGAFGAGASAGSMWWMNPPMWNAIDSSIRLVDQSANHLDKQIEEPPLPAGPVIEAPNIGPPPSPSQFPVNDITDTPLGNLEAPGMLGARRSLRIGGTRLRYGAQISTSGAYVTNVFGTSQNPQNDFIFYLQPALVLEAGTKSSVRVIYAPSILKYARFKQFDTVNQNILFSSRTRFNKLEIGMDAAYLTQSGLFLSSQGQAQQQSLMARVFSNYKLTKKTDLMLALETQRTDSGDGGNQSGYSFGTGLEHRLTRKTSVGIGLMIGHFYLPQGTTNFQNLLLRLRYSPSAKLFLTADGGIQLRQSRTMQGQSYNTAGPLLEAKLTWLPTRKTTAAVRIFRNVSVDPFSPDSIQTATGGELEITWQMLNRTKLEGKIGSGFVENTSLSGQEGQSYFFNQGTLAVIHNSQDGMNFRVFTGFQQRLDTANALNNYLSTLSGMQLGLDF